MTFPVYAKHYHPNYEGLLIRFDDHRKATVVRQGTGRYCSFVVGYSTTTWKIGQDAWIPVPLYGANTFITI